MLVVVARPEFGGVVRPVRAVRRLLIGRVLPQSSRLQVAHRVLGGEATPSPRVAALVEQVGLCPRQVQQRSQVVQVVQVLGCVQPVP